MSIRRIAKRVAYIDFPDEEGLTIEASEKQIPPDLVPQTENPLEKVAREKYEQRVRTAFSRGVTVPAVQARGATWDEAISMGLEWLLESGRERKVYRDGTPQVHDMVHAHRVLEAREYFYRKNIGALQGGASLQPVTGYDGSFYPVGPLRAGNNPTQQFVGSYTIDIYPNRNGTITFVLTNVTSVHSATYKLGPEYPRGLKGFGGNQTQIYTWTEPVRLRK